MDEKIPKEAYNEDTLSTLAATNEPDYNLLKAVEEMAELSELLMKKVIKGEHKYYSKQAIIEEIGDVAIRLMILGIIYGEEHVEKRISDKIIKYREYLSEGKYIGRI